LAIKAEEVPGKKKRPLPFPEAAAYFRLETSDLRLL